MWVVDDHRYPTRDWLMELPNLFAMLRMRTQRREDGWAELPDELMAKVLELLHAAGRSEPQAGGFAFSQASATVRLVCAGWKAVHDALVMRLLLRRQTTDEAVGMLVRRFPAVASIEMKRDGADEPFPLGMQVVMYTVLTDAGMRAVSSLPALTSLILHGCDEFTGAVSNLPALTTLDLTACYRVTDKALRAVSSLPKLTSLNLRACFNITDEGMRAVSSMPALTFLDLGFCENLTDKALRAVSSLPALTSLSLAECPQITGAVSNLPALTFLDLTECDVTDEALRAVIK